MYDCMYVCMYDCMYSAPNHVRMKIINTNTNIVLVLLVYCMLCCVASYDLP